MVAAGAKGYVLKTDAPTNVTKAIRTVAAGGSYFDKVVPGRSYSVAQDGVVVQELSADELAVIKRLADGRTNTQIAADLKLALPVVERRRAAPMKKLNLRNRAELARVAALRHWFTT
jgi:DNA-binding NarL/FixJ family response regulator